MRKLDYYGQVVLLSAIVLCALMCIVKAGFIIISMLGLMILGPWQIISAITISSTPQVEIYKKQMRRYWTACIIILVLLIGSLTLLGLKHDLTSLFVVICSVAGLIVAFFYLHLYNKIFFSVRRS